MAPMATEPVMQPVRGGAHPRISRRIAGVAPSATLAIDAKAKALKAAGEDVIGFGAGEPDFPTPVEIVEVAAEACRNPANHRYTPAAGLPALREAIADATLRYSGMEVSPSQVLVTNGGKHAVSTAFATILDPGDEVLIPAPYWTTFAEAVSLAGGVPVVVPTTADQGFKATAEQLERATTERTKVVLLVSPSNPTGAVYSPEQLADLGRFAEDKGLWVVSDDIYQHLVYGGRERRSIYQAAPGLLDRIVLVDGVAKTYAMTGWRVGWMVGPPDVMAAACNLQSQQTSNVANVSQQAALAALRMGPEGTKDMVEAFDRRRQTIFRKLGEIPGVSCIEPEGAFYAFPSMEGLLGIPIEGRIAKTTMELAEIFLDLEKVAVVPGEAFEMPGYVRMSYALGDADLEEGVARIGRLAQSALG